MNNSSAADSVKSNLKCPSNCLFFFLAVGVGGGGFPCGSAGKESACNVGYQGSIPGLGRSPGEGKGKTTHSSILALENSMDCIVHGVAKSRTRLSSFHFHFPTVFRKLPQQDGLRRQLVLPFWCPEWANWQQHFQGSSRSSVHPSTFFFFSLGVPLA